MGNNRLRLNELTAQLIKRNIEGFFCPDKASALQKTLTLIPEKATVGISGSLTLIQLDLIKSLKERGTIVYDQYLEGLSRKESMALRNKGACADYYLTSANAISAKGELVFFSAWGNRVAGIANAGKVVVIAGINKISVDLQSAMKRAREYVTPLNCKRLGYASACAQDGICRNDICLFPEHKRMCCQLLIVEAEITPGRMKVVLVGEELGY
ncbi:MAG: lactate utilization protein [Candidatus Omnitrophota bacterium]|jgi:hypothetical protein|nr:MAG: lactate utilization protein [Candidatus Omnitrophota bacterium]